MSGRHMFLGMLCLVLAAGVARGASQEMMPEFGSSVEFDKQGPDISISKLKGKGVLILFFQSWCPICNGWSPDLIKQIQDAHGNNRGLILAAIKTDGGGVSGAREYLKTAGANLDQWFVGADSGATFYKKLMGKDDLWNYVLVNAEGNIAMKGQAGMFQPVGANGKKFQLADNEVIKACGKTTTLLPADRKYSGQAAKITRYAEVGAVSKALSLCDSAMRQGRDAAAKAEIETLRADMGGILEKILKENMEILKDAQKESSARYEAFKTLETTVKDAKTLPAAKDAQALLTQMGSDPALSKEKSAEIAYSGLAVKAGRASDKDKPKLAREFDALAKRFPDTRYGKLAADQAESLAAAKGK